jgi:hypothetical protein
MADVSKRHTNQLRMREGNAVRMKVRTCFPVLIFALAMNSNHMVT